MQPPKRPLFALRTGLCMRNLPRGLHSLSEEGYTYPPNKNIYSEEGALRKGLPRGDSGRASACLGRIVLTARLRSVGVIMPKRQARKNIASARTLFQSSYSSCIRICGCSPACFVGSWRPIQIRARKGQKCENSEMIENI